MYGNLEQAAQLTAENTCTFTIPRSCMDQHSIPSLMTEHMTVSCGQ